MNEKIFFIRKSIKLIRDKLTEIMALLDSLEDVRVH